MSETPTTPSYQSGFGNTFDSEAVAGALPQGQFNPQRPPLGLYAEQFSTTAFTAPRADNRRTWFYRIRPSVTQGDFRPLDHPRLLTAPLAGKPPPNVLRWSPFAIPDRAQDFVDGLVTLAANGNAQTQHGIGIHMYLANRSMQQRVFYSADGELLLVPQLGGLRLRTECGVLHAAPGEIAVVPRGMRFAVELLDDTARGYVCENYGHPLVLPERGPIGANGLANERDFLAPVAAYENNDAPWQIVAKFCGGLHVADIDHCPLDVVAWTGNSVPYKYDLARFNTMGSISFDHPDPSIFTVLTSPSATPGTANVDFVIFPPRWLVAEGTFRPPWFHRNIMSEFMGLIHGQYDAKEAGFEPGGASLHNCFSPHGPEAAVVEKAEASDLAPQKLDDTLAFMFESRYVIAPTRWALESAARQAGYIDCWDGLQRRFDGTQAAK